MKKIFYFAFCAALAGIFCFGGEARAATACTSLSRELSQGSNDSLAGGEVTKLQNYLKAVGYLSATPNGNFGPATLAAVKAFQVASGIPATGVIGPLSRLAIQVKSCASPSLPPSPSPSPVTVATTSTISGTSPSTGLKRVFAPGDGTRLTLGSTYLVAWDQSGASQSVVLEDQHGVAQGFITSSVAASAHYSWLVGSVFSTKTQGTIVVPPGTYRIRVSGWGMNDQLSGWFTIEVPPVEISLMKPAQMAADNNSVGFLYGKGFTGAVALYIDDRWGTPVNRLYTSPDGTILVFSLPPSVSPGTHWIIVDSGYGTNLTAGSVFVTSSPQ